MMSSRYSSAVRVARALMASRLRAKRTTLSLQSVENFSGCQRAAAKKARSYGDRDKRLGGDLNVFRNGLSILNQLSYDHMNNFVNML